MPSLIVRVVRLRIGLVLGTQGGLLRRLLVPFELGLGGPIGTGAQWMSWIERDDLVRLIAHIIATPSLCGAINATAHPSIANTKDSPYTPMMGANRIGTSAGAEIMREMGAEEGG